MRRSLLVVVSLVASAVSAQPAPEADSLDAATLDLLPDRTAEALGGLLLGSGDDPALLPLDYRSAGGVQPVVDGLRARRTGGLPQAALAGLALPTGYVSPRLGNALGAFVEIDTRDAPREDLGRAEGTGGLDAFGYGRAEVGTGLASGRLRLYAAGTFERADDLDPRAYGTPALPADELAALREAPQVIRVDRARADAAGFDASRARYTSEDTYYVPLPPAVVGGSPAALAEALGLSDPAAIASPNPLQSLAVRPGEIPVETDAPGAAGERLRGHLALDARLTDAVGLRLSGQGFRESGRDVLTAFALAAPEAMPATRDEGWRAAAEVEAALGSGTLTLTAGTERTTLVRYDGRFSDAIGDAILYSDIDDPANAAAARYLRFGSEGVYEPAFRDGQINPSPAYDLFAPVGAGGVAYHRETASVGRLAADYRQRLGAVEVVLGAEAERQTLRGVALSALRLARFVADGDVEAPVVDLDGDGVPEAGVSAYADLPYAAVRNSAVVYGYDYLGLEAAAGTSVESFYEAAEAGTLTLAPRRPAYAAGFAEGTWERGDLTVRAGLRVARFSSNANALFDPYAVVAIYRANDLATGSFTDAETGERVEAPSGGVPASIPSTAALYVGDGAQVVGYRDLEGRFYDATGAEVDGSEIVTVGRVLAVGGGSSVTPEVLTDAPSSIRVLPRVEAVLRPTGSTALSAFVNRFARQPDPAQAFPTIADVENVRSGQGLIPNGALRPETLTEVGVGVRQSLGREGGTRAEVGATLFLRRYRDRVRMEVLRYAFPSQTTTFVNGGSADVPGATVRLGIRAGRLQARGAVTVLRESFDVPSPVGLVGDRFAFDALATDAVALLTVAMEPTDGPALGSFFPLGDARLGAVLRVASGDPYTASGSRVGPIDFPEAEPLAPGSRDRTPTRARLDVRLARVFRLGPTALEASVEVVNVLGRVNALRVYPATGLPDDDGFLATGPPQVAGLGTEAERAAYRALYSARVRDPLNVGRPRQVRLGLRLEL